MAMLIDWVNLQITFEQLCMKWNRILNHMYSRCINFCLNFFVIWDNCFALECALRSEMCVVAHLMNIREAQWFNELLDEIVVCGPWQNMVYSLQIKLIIYESILKTNIIIGNILRSFCLILVKERYTDLIEYKKASN